MSQISQNLTAVDKPKLLVYGSFVLRTKLNGYPLEESFAHESKQVIIFHNKQPPYKFKPIELRFLIEFYPPSKSDSLH